MNFAYFAVNMYLFGVVFFYYSLDQVIAVPPEACFANFRWDDCGKPPVRVMYYWKPGSRCEVALWRGCLPNPNMFRDEYECVQTCIFTARALPSDYHKIEEEQQDIQILVASDSENISGNSTESMETTTTIIDGETTKSEQNDSNEATVLPLKLKITNVTTGNKKSKSEKDNSKVTVLPLNSQTKNVTTENKTAKPEHQNSPQAKEPMTTRRAHKASDEAAIAHVSNEQVTTPAPLPSKEKKS